MKTLKMRMICAVVVAMTAVSCSQNDEPQKGHELVFSIAPTSRATANYPVADYLALDAQVAVTADGANSIYRHNDGLLEHESGDQISFPAYNQPLVSVELSWPVNGSYSVDQTTKEAFLFSDALTCSFTNLMPSLVIPVEFSHVNYKMTFTMGGTNNGQRISSLSIIGATDTYQAFCDPSINDAQLMLIAGTDLGGTIGTLTLEGETTPRVFNVPAYTVPVAGTLNQNITVNIIL